MTTTERRSWGATVFCDDIRAEVGGKTTLIGIYTNQLLVHAPFPFVMPKFGLWINYYEVPGSMSGDGKLYVTLPGDNDRPSIEADVPMSPLRSQRDPKAAEDPDVDKWDRLLVPMLLSPFILQEPGRILVRLHFEETVVRLGALTVKSAPAAESGSG